MGHFPSSSTNLQPQPREDVSLPRPGFLQISQELPRVCLPDGDALGNGALLGNGERRPPRKFIISGLLNNLRQFCGICQGSGRRRKYWRSRRHSQGFLCCISSSVLTDVLEVICLLVTDKICVLRSSLYLMAAPFFSLSFHRIHVHMYNWNYAIFNWKGYYHFLFTYIGRFMN